MRSFKIALAVVVLVVFAFSAVTRMRNVAIINSSIDSSPIGQVTPSGGTFTNLALTRGLLNTSAVKIQNFGAGGTLCTSGVNVGDTCTTTVTWANAFTDTSYTILCQGVTQHQNGYLTVESKTNTGFAIRTTLAGGPSGTGAHYDEADCIGIHAGF